MAKFPGIPSITDGSGAVVWVETHISEAACSYPITSTTNMGQSYQQTVAAGSRNLWGTPLAFLEPESEHSSATAAEGFALAGGRVTNFTSGQGLILMKEVLYVISGKRLPVVFHIGARALTSHSLNVHAGHDDIMGVADTGWGILFARNAQEAADFTLIARRAAEASYTPFFVVQDGFLTTHTLERVLLPEPELMKDFVGDPRRRLINLFDPRRPVMSGVVQNQESYMRGKIAQREYVDRVGPALQEAFAAFAEATGRSYGSVDAYRMEDAEYAFVAMGSMAETAQAVVDHLRESGEKVGLVAPLVFRPFPGPDLVEHLASVRALTVIERLDEPLSRSNPLARELKAAFADALTGESGYPPLSRIPVVLGGAAGLGSRDVSTSSLLAAYRALARGHRDYYVLGIRHPLALEETETPDLRPKGAFSLRGHSIGGFGSVTTNKVIATIVGDLLGLYVQAYPKYGSEKKGLPTTYYLTVAEEPIRVHAELTSVDFVPLNDLGAFRQGDPLHGLREGGILFVSANPDPEHFWHQIPQRARETMQGKEIRVYALDTVSLAESEAPTADLRQRMQGIALLGVFLRVTPLIQGRGLSEEELFAGVERSLTKYFGRRGEKVVQANLRMVRRAYSEVVEVRKDPLLVRGG